MPLFPHIEKKSNFKSNLDNYYILSLIYIFFYFKHIYFDLRATSTTVLSDYQKVNFIKYSPVKYILK